MKSMETFEHYFHEIPIHFMKACKVVLSLVTVENTFLCMSIIQIS